MDSLDRPDIVRLDAALGWLGLGDMVSANAELEEITPLMRSHPDVLAVRWQIYAKAERWDACVDIAEAVVALAPEKIDGWVYRSFALHALERTPDALEKLLPAAIFFPRDITIRYNLACYECVLGNMNRAKIRLSEALDLAITQDCSEEWRLRALGDPDLEPLSGDLKEVEIPE